MGVTSAHADTGRRRGPLLDRLGTRFVTLGFEYWHLQQLVGFPIVLDVDLGLVLVLVLVLVVLLQAVRNRAQPNACV